MNFTLRKKKLKRWILRQVIGGWTYVKYEDLVNLSRDFAGQLIGHDCVVGIPRIGLVVAGVIATHLGLPLFTPSELPKDKFQKILLVDDGCCRTDGAMAKIALQIHPKTKAAIFTGKIGAEYLDKYMWLVNQPILYEWDLFHLNLPCIDENRAFDIDGVLCKDPEGHVTTETYALNAKPYMLPNFRIGCIITGRPEHLMEPTKAWLKKHNIEYGKIVFTQDKVRSLLEVNPSLYYESDYSTAKLLAKKTHIPIIAIDRMELIYS